MPKVMMVTRNGASDVLTIEDQPTRKPAAGEVMLRLQAVGMNRAEVLFRQGRYLEQAQPPTRIGYEGAGVVQAVGEGVDPAWVGKRAATIPGFSMRQYGLWAEEAIVPASVLVETPSALSTEQSAAVWMQYATAYGGLLEAGQFKAGEIALITAGSSSVALAALEIVKDLGGTAILTTRTSRKKAELKQLGADHVIATEEEDLPARVKEITSGKGADVIFDPIAGSFVETLAKCAAWRGRLIEYGGLSLEPAPFPFRAALHHQLTMRGYTLHMVTADPTLRARAVQYITSGLNNGNLKPKIARVFHGLERVPSAQDYMESNEQVGKIVVVF